MRVCLVKVNFEQKKDDYPFAIKVISMLEIVVIHRVSEDLRGPFYNASVATKFTLHWSIPHLGVCRRSL